MRVGPTNQSPGTPMLDDLTTEGRNPASEHIDSLSAAEIVRLINAEDALVADAVRREAAAIGRAVEVIAERLGAGGRLIYLGAGTSGRLGVLDAAECPPTFNTPPEMVLGIIAGGTTALVRAVEGAEDQPDMAVQDLKAVGLCQRDVVVGIATSGRTPYVLGGLEYAQAVGAYRIGLSCNRDAALARRVDLGITPVVGPEVISGSTRMKAGTATKMVLNMLSTGAMVRLGKTYGNLMVDLRATNSKLRDRSRRIVMALTGLGAAEAQRQLDQCGGELKTAIVSCLACIDADESRRRLARAGGHLRRAIAAGRADAHGAGQPPPTHDLVLGMDGGGTKTVAWLAPRAAADGAAVCGRGAAGPSNPQAVGFPKALENLDAAVAAAFADARLAPGTIASAVLALAGSDRPQNRQVLEEWAARRRLARRFSVVNDALPVLAAGSPEGWGIALVAGTGSFAFGRARDGRTCRAGGWGFLFGDEGSAYAMAVAGLRAVAQAADGRAPPTLLLDALLRRLDLARPEELVAAVYPLAADRAAVATLAEVVTEAARAGDTAAQRIVAGAAEDLAALVAAVATKLELREDGFPLALSGGVLLANPEIRQTVENRLRRLGLRAQPVAAVTEPVSGAVALARSAAGASSLKDIPSGSPFRQPSNG